MKRFINGALTVAILAVFLFLLFVVLTRAQTAEVVATGGTFALEKTVIGGGGTEKQLAPVGENGTAGQAIAGQRSSGGLFSIYSGFWTPDAFIPTAANVSVGGRIINQYGIGIPNVTITLAAASGDFKVARSSTLGYYTFDGVEVGATYLVTVSSKRYTFDEPARAVHVADQVTNADFVGRIGGL